jgi:hypothetical protein
LAARDCRLAITAWKAETGKRWWVGRRRGAAAGDRARPAGRG